MTKYFICVKTDDSKLPLYHPIIFDSPKEVISEAKAMLEMHHNKGLKAYVDKADEDDVMITGVRLKFENKETVEIIE